MSQCPNFLTPTGCMGFLQIFRSKKRILFSLENLAALVSSVPKLPKTQNPMSKFFETKVKANFLQRSFTNRIVIFIEIKSVKSDKNSGKRPTHYSPHLRNKKYVFVKNQPFSSKSVKIQLSRIYPIWRSSQNFPRI